MRQFGTVLLLGLTLAACTTSEPSQEPSAAPTPVVQPANPLPTQPTPAPVVEAKLDGNDGEWTQALFLAPEQVLVDQPFTRTGVKRNTLATYEGGRVALWWSEEGYLSAAAAVQMTDGTWTGASRLTQVALPKVPRFTADVARVDPVDAPMDDPGIWAVYGHVGDTNVTIVEVSGADLPPIKAKVQNDVWVALYLDGAPADTLTIVGRDAAGQEVARTTRRVNLDQ